MIELRQHKKDIDFSAYDYVFEDVKKFEDVLPFLLPKLEGEWNVLLVEPKLAQIRTYLDTTIVPSYIHLVITVEASQLSQLYLERPGLVEKEKTSWDIYMELLKSFQVPMDDKAMREIYKRKGPKEEDLRKALEELADYPAITISTVNKHFAPVHRVYANQVVRSFLCRDFKRAWRMLSILESELGTPIAFYAMRKNIRRIYEEKCKYLRNEDTREWIVSKVDGYTIILLYWWFEEATSPEQLYPILTMFERRQTPCSLSAKLDMSLPQST